MRKINRLERFNQASMEIRTALLLVGNMLSRAEHAQNTYAAGSQRLTVEALDISYDILATIRRAQTQLRPMSTQKTPEERKKAEQRAARRRELRQRTS